MKLSGRRVLLGVTGGIAAFKIPSLVRALKREGAEVRVVLTEGARAFVTPLTLETVSGARVFLPEDFLRPQGGFIPHTELARWAELVLVAPATASFLSALRMGDASSLLVACLLATEAPGLIFPAMNEKMWSHPATQENVQILRNWGYTVVSPDEGPLACGESGPGRLPSEEVILAYARRLLSPPDLSGLRVVVTCGPTREPVDLVRYLSNRSSGRMGLALAQAAFERGAEVVLIHGPLSVPIPPLFTRVPVETTAEMQEALLEHFPAADVLFMVAAVADYRPVNFRAEKIKRRERLVLELEPTPDLLAEVSRKRRPGQVIVGFAAEEAENLASEAARKLRQKGLDLLVANPIDRPGAGFEAETNEVLILDREGRRIELSRRPKEEIAEKILDQVVRLRETS
ncbi:MAG: bifunctional phosphopantothenoylcysteine decarboxylase/phosphopantothenate--cysteine ligase CoaBC [Thermodesulfobacteria bacterium]|nr:bifunctional phosphopantothenoylcysteine decarboxylase/phosphopantothenate--cysteine ligase CoaBC [Thermodesulfobacteriota bacterium]